MQYSDKFYMALVLGMKTFKTFVLIWNITKSYKVLLVSKQADSEIYWNIIDKPVHWFWFLHQVLVNLCNQLIFKNVAQKRI